MVESPTSVPSEREKMGDERSIMVKSISFSEKDVEKIMRQVCFKDLDTRNMIISEGSERSPILEAPSFKRWETKNLKVEIALPSWTLKPLLDNEESFSFIPDGGCKFPPTNQAFHGKKSINSPCDWDSAALKLQKVYKSYRTRRNLADCAVVVEELWWKALDFAALKRSSVSFYNIQKQESAVSFWSRARTRAAKVGKGLSKDEKAQKLALQHWLEAIDPRHRYGHNLHFYYDVWFDSESCQPFFYWLDVGDGKEVNLEKCPRADLQCQCIKYLGPNEREAYEVIVEDGKLVYKQCRRYVDTSEGNKGTKWIFVLSTSRTLYVGQKKKGEFQHSSFLAGGAISSAGRLVVDSGILKAIWPYSGHYHPTEENFKEFVTFLEENKVDLTDVKRCAIDDDRPPSIANKETEIKKTEASPRSSSLLDVVGKAITAKAKEAQGTVQLGNRLLSKWSTGAGPRIGCVRDYPANLQSKALEQVNLSPRVTLLGNTGPIPSPRPSPKVRLSPRLSGIGIPT